MKVVKITLLYILVMGIGACQDPTIRSQPSKKTKLHARKPHLQRIISDQAYERNKAFNLMKALKPNESKESLKRIFPQLFAEFRKSTKQDKPSIYETINLLGQQQHAFSVLSEFYKEIPAKDYLSRHFMLCVIGEMRRPEGLSFLREIVWSPLPQVKRNVYLSERQFEAMIRAKAVQGIAYLRTKEAYKELIKVMQTHESHIVRIGAIEAYKWNLGYNEKKLTELKKILPKEYHVYVNRRGRHKMLHEGTISQR